MGGGSEPLEVTNPRLSGEQLLAENRSEVTNSQLLSRGWWVSSCEPRLVGSTVWTQSRSMNRL